MLLADWKRILRRAWSMRLMALAGLLTGGEAVIQIKGVDWLPGPQWARLLIILGVIGGAFIARLMAQQMNADAR